MNTSVRFPYTGTGSQRSQMNTLAYLPINLANDGRSITVPGLLDSGSTVNVLPYTMGLQLGLIWEHQTTAVTLTGNVARLPARGVILQGAVEPFRPVELAFAWTRATELPLILGQVNFFAEFDVCFYHSQGVFEVKPTIKGRQISDA